MALPGTVVKAQQSRVVGLILRRIAMHPRLEPIRQEGRTVVVTYDARGGSARVAAQQDRSEVEVRLAIADWWDGRRFTTEDWAHMLGNALAEDLRTSLEEPDRDERTTDGRCPSAAYCNRAAGVISP